MSEAAPWSSGDHAARWNGYLIAPDSPVLRNKVGATTVEALSAAENDLLEFRVAELRSKPMIVPGTYDPAHLKAIHFRLFRDIFEWAGELRTVGIAKGDGQDTSFIPPLEIDRPVAHVASRIADSDRLRAIPSAELVDEVTYLYDYLNFAHPFREGNGRTQREFFAQLVAEWGHGLDWSEIDMNSLHSACHVARVDGDTSKLRSIISAAITNDPVY
ncbi:Fic/DOC family protein [Nocardioides sp. B-3]|uniref:Fic/DOC family protein n=1 Tax=Nocardioides sp. B-3 TaxID=2895565 RepID=UPI0021527EC3|nr:Fic family protein [Nocardioides sp. B-3]UUZ58216.1 Fic family protein [Nocardioides sp. B-3]